MVKDYILTELKITMKHELISDSDLFIKMEKKIHKKKYLDVIKMDACHQHISQYTRFGTYHVIVSGWVVTWFLLGYTVRMFEYTVRTF